MEVFAHSFRLFFILSFWYRQTLFSLTKGQLSQPSQIHLESETQQRPPAPSFHRTACHPATLTTTAATTATATSTAVSPAAHPTANIQSGRDGRTGQADVTKQRPDTRSLPEHSDPAGKPRCPPGRVNPRPCCRSGSGGQGLIPISRPSSGCHCTAPAATRSRATNQIAGCRPITDGDESGGGQQAGAQDAALSQSNGAYGQRQPIVKRERVFCE